MENYIFIVVARCLLPSFLKAPDIMSDSPSLDLSGAVDTSLAIHAQDETFDLPVSAIASARASFHLPTLGDEYDSTINVKLMGWVGSAQDAATPLGGSFDRWRVYAGRLNVAPPYFGIPTLNAEGRFKTPGIKLYAGISPQEDYVYPYNFNSTSMEKEGYEWSPTTLRYNLVDNTSGANIYVATIGWLFGMEWAPDYLEGLRVVAQAGPDGGFAGSPSWAKTVQAGYTREYSGEIDGATSVTLFGTSLNPAEPTNELGETISPKNGMGGFFSQQIGRFNFGVGYAFNRQVTEGEESRTISRVDGINAGYSIRLADGEVPVILSGAYSYLGLLEKTDASGQKRTGEHSLEPINVTIGLLPGMALSAGWNLVLVDSANQADAGTPKNEQTCYVALTFIGNKTID